MTNIKTITILAVILILTVLGITLFNSNNTNNQPTANLSSPNLETKIGVITDLTGPASYWGKSTQVGIKIAQEELKNKGYQSKFIFEDYKLLAPNALNSVNKLNGVDNVDAFYVEFNPGTYTVSPFLKDKNKIMLYDASPTSPLLESDNYFKTYLDYEKGCEQMANKFKLDGVTKIASLQPKIEFGDLCTKGVQKVFTNATVENYNLGDDSKNLVTKLNQQGIEAIINTGFEADTANILKAIGETNSKIRIGVTTDTLTPTVKKQYSKELKGSYNFGFGAISNEFINKVKAIDPSVTSYDAAALGYIHAKQLVTSLVDCQKELNCTKDKISKSKPESIIPFQNFVDRKANFETLIGKVE